MSTPRHRIEQASLPALTALSHLPKAVPFLGVLALMVAGVFVPGWGWVFTALVVVFLLWVLYLAWPRLDGTQRIMRTTVALLAGAITLTQLFPRG